nr:hypothetical protein [Tanacetum cinerariifolium]
MDHEIGTYGVAIDYWIMKEGMSILRGRKSVPGMNSNEREMERKPRWGNDPGKLLATPDLLIRLKNSHMLDHEVTLIHSLELSGDHPQSLGQSYNALRLNRPCALAR